MCVLLLFLIVLYVVNETTWFSSSCSYPRIYVTASNWPTLIVRICSFSGFYVKYILTSTYKSEYNFLTLSVKTAWFHKKKLKRSGYYIMSSSRRLGKFWRIRWNMKILHHPKNKHVHVPTYFWPDITTGRKSKICTSAIPHISQ